jgi:MinD-like ATPase involved in chromosome partitioning or flagellar assembly
VTVRSSHVGGGRYGRDSSSDRASGADERGEAQVDDLARVILGLEEHDVAEEVMHFLDRSGQARVVATAGDGRQLAEAVRQLEPDAVVAQPSVAAGTPLHGSALLALETRESVASLRSAISSGARGYYLWPAEREALAGAAAAVRMLPAARERRARVIAVHASRGGAGATFVATHLAAALARRELRTAIVDLDLCFGDLTAALGAPDDARTLTELAPLAAESSLGDALWSHPNGFRAVFAPTLHEQASMEIRDAQAVVAALAAEEDAVVLHLSRAPDELARWAFGFADRAVEVLSLDVLSFRAATRCLTSLGDDDRVGFVVNRASRAEITPADVERVFGRAPLAVLPTDRGVGAAQDHGRLLPRRGRTGRAFDRLAARCQEGPPS